MLFADGEHNLGKQSVNLDLDDGARELVAAADARRSKMCRAGRQKLLKSADRNAVVAVRAS